MSTRRRAAYRFTGKGQCRWCGEPPKPPRQTWCSEVCVEEFRVRAWPAHARQKVKDRDGGVCAACGLDTEELKATARAVRLKRGYQDGLDVLEAKGFERSYSRHLWEADHIVPVVEGGGGCGLDNLRTLCVPCHKRETAALAARLAARRRAGGTP